MEQHRNPEHLRHRRAIVLFVRDARREAACKPLGGRFGAHGYRGLNSRIAARLSSLLDRATDLLVVSESGGAYGGIRQRGATFGERITNAMADTLAAGYRSVAVVGNDCPSIAPADITAAFQRLDAGALIVAAPACDGGAFIVAARGATFEKSEYRERFIDLPWRTSSLFDAMMLLEGAEGLPVVREDFDHWQGRSAERALAVLFDAWRPAIRRGALPRPVRSAACHKALTRTFLTSPPLPQ
ncbi:MAG TPA: DUF2064 domain-containing protein [Candidatus Kapabacteria bacterium]|nr:DUF2064 domain-containing protein [Candidatus Kapabacteria bacterium]